MFMKIILLVPLALFVAHHVGLPTSEALVLPKPVDQVSTLTSWGQQDSLLRLKREEEDEDGGEDETEDEDEDDVSVVSDDGDSNEDEAEVDKDDPDDADDVLPEVTDVVNDPPIEDPSVTDTVAEEVPSEEQPPEASVVEEEASPGEEVAAENPPADEPQVTEPVIEEQPEEEPPNAEEQTVEDPPAEAVVEEDTPVEEPTVTEDPAVEEEPTEATTAEDEVSTVVDAQETSEDGALTTTAEAPVDESSTADEAAVEEAPTEAPAEESPVVEEYTDEDGSASVTTNEEVIPTSESEITSTPMPEPGSHQEYDDLDEVSKMLELQDKSEGGCASSKFGCCPDGVTPAHGARKEGCCLGSPHGCCLHDFITSASGPDQAGCDCSTSEFGCCPESSKSATGPNNEGCGCSFTLHGCCPDQIHVADGPEFEGCSCHTHDFGCCPDGLTIAKGPKLEGCPGCAESQFGCCEDGTTQAAGPDQQGCGCAGSKFGCCPDGVKVAEGPAFEGCGEMPGEACFLPKNDGNCKEDFIVRWFFDISYGGCSRFWYGNCKDAATETGKVANRFLDQASCENMCVKTPGNGRCYLPKVKGPCDASITSYYFDKQWNQCVEFQYGGCLGNANRFETKQACLESCVHSEDVGVCSQPAEPGACRGTYERFFYDDESGQCRKFNYTGCKGNANRFLTFEACENSCKHHSLLVAAKRRCVQPKRLGDAHCNKTEAKWYFDTKSKGCKPFIYTGCGGNENLFDSLRECQIGCPNAFPPEIEVITKLVVAEEGKEAILQVKVEANPLPSISWQFEDEKIEFTERIQKMANGSLRITAAEINDTGTWTLIADNRLGQVARKQIALKVHPSSMPIEVTISKEKTVFKNGKEILLACQVKGYPIPAIRWYKNNSPVSKSSRLTILDDNTLVISKASTIDRGSYMCKATNKHESVSDKIDISVEMGQVAKECVDKPEYANCDLIVKGNYCTRNEYYADFCCLSCTKAGLLPPPPPTN